MESAKEMQAASAALDRLLQEDNRYHPQTGGPIANHCPMTLLALHGMGATAEQLDNFNQSYSGHRVLLGSGKQNSANMTKDNWTLHLGDRSYVRAYLEFFSGELERLGGREAVLGEYLPHLQFGQAKGLWHPTIRLSFALGYQDDYGVALALAYFAIRFHPLYVGAERDPRWQVDKISDIEGQQDTPSVVELWRTLNERVDIHAARIAGLSTFDAVDRLANMPHIREKCLRGFTVTAENVDRVAQEVCLCALRLYAARPALTTLHALTGSQALATILPSLHNAHTRVVSVSLLWIWLSCLFLEKGSPRQAVSTEEDDDEDNEGRDVEGEWKAVMTAACSSPHVHVIKFVYSCRLLWQTNPDNLYLKVSRSVVRQGWPW